MNNQLVSVIIPTYNSAAWLEKCLRSIENQTYPFLEVVIVDNYSRDCTVNIARNHCASVVLLRGGCSQARNVGSSFAKGGYIFSVDSDMELSLDLVNECVFKMRRGYDCLIIPEISTGDSFWAKCKSLERSFYVGNDFIEAARFFKKMAFDSVGGFDPSLQAGEDWDIAIRLRKAGFNFGRTERSITHHEGNLSLREAVTKKYQYGKTVNLYKHKHPAEARAQLGITRLKSFRNIRKIRGRPQYAIGFMMMKACEYIFLRISSRTAIEPDNQSLSRPSQSTIAGFRLPKCREAT